VTTERIDRAFSAGLLLLGAFVVWKAVEYGYMRDAAPGPGFFPLWIGLGIVVLSAVNLVRSVRGLEPLKETFDRTSLYGTLGIVAAVAAFIVLSPVIGMLLGSALLIPAIALCIRQRWTRRFAATIVLIAVLFPVVCHLLFGVYLRVPLTRGVFGF
jgi:putative tricarboxylic transport membrane protein